MNKYDFTPSELNLCLYFDFETGVITNRVDRGTYCNPQKAGARSGCRKSDGYRYICFKRVVVSEHQLFFFMANGHWAKEIDHINGIKDDNRICNLRAVTKSENSQNIKRAPCNSASGILGVSWHKRSRKWRVNIGLNGKKIYLGIFTSIEDAKAARIAAEKIYHPSKPSV